MSIVVKWLDEDATWYRRVIGPGHIVLDRDPAPPCESGTVALPSFRQNFVIRRLGPALVNLCTKFEVSTSTLQNIVKVMKKVQNGGGLG